MPDIMTSDEVAAYLRTSVQNVKRLARRGDLPAWKLGRNWRFSRADIDGWAATGGSDYEARVTEGLAAVTRERMRTAREEDLVDWDEAKASLGL
jgi:excisionase family DNA binding protein